MPVFQVNWVENPISLEEDEYGRTTKEAVYRSIEIVIGPIQIQLGRRVAIDTYDRRPRFLPKRAT